MNIHTTTNRMKSLEKRTYPWLGVMANEVVVLFFREHVGTVINQMDVQNFPFGTHKTSWYMDEFEPYYGEVRVTSSISLLGE